MKARVIGFKQEGTQMYLGVMRVEDLLGISKVDVWRQEEGKDIGYQRAPEAARTGKIARFLQSDKKPLMPTSVLISHRGKLDGANDDNFITTIEIPDNVTLWIVDGQHRIYGFEKAINELGIKRFKDYLLPVVIVEFPTIEEEANQFRIINETMKKVRTDLARRILAIRVNELGSAGRKELQMSGRIWEASAVEVLKILSQSPDSPWVTRIQSPNSRKQPTHVVRELSFTTSLKPILTEYPYRTWTPERIANTLKEFWKAWKNLAKDAFDHPQDYVIMKTPGVFSLHNLALHVMEVLRVRGILNPIETDFHNILRDLGEFADSSYWEVGNDKGAAMAGSMKGFSILADAMIEELSTAGHTTE